MKKETIRNVATLDNAIRENSKDYINSRVLAQTYEKDLDYSVVYDMKDILLIGAITNSDLLMTGRTGSGKTHLAKMVMNALFGNNYFNKTVTPNMSKSDFMDIDFGAIKTGRKTLKEAVMAMPLLHQPGIILNEINRSPDLIQAILIPFFDREFEIEGKEVDLGVENNGKQYQYRILTINEGDKYRVQGIDKAIRDRAVIEIPVDMFSQTKEDVKDMLKVRRDSSLKTNRDEQNLELVLEASTETENLDLSYLALDYISYLSGMSNCIKSNTNSKEGINFSLDLCKGCHNIAYDNGLCGNVYAPSPRALINLQKAAKGFGLLRVYKIIKGISEGEIEGDVEFVNRYSENLTIGIDDVLASTPFVLYSKIDINPEWISKNFQGSKLKAIEFTTKKAYEKFIKFYRENKELLVNYAQGKELNEEQISILKSYVTETDPWMYNLNDLEQNEKQIIEKRKKQPLDYLLK